jgi:secretion/DNA translocation related TadE-like protein
VTGLAIARSAAAHPAPGHPAAAARHATTTRSAAPARHSAAARSASAAGPPAGAVRVAIGKPHGRARGEQREIGSATVWVLAVGLVFALLAAAVAVAGAAVVARHRAQSAADLAALAAALVALDGEQAACARAEQVTSRNGARLVACRLEGLDVVVTVEVSAGLGDRAGPAEASARAGPVDPELS